MSHIPVMLDEVVKQLELKPEGVYLDLTVGYGGHASEILRAIPKGFLVGVDRDVEAIRASQKKLERVGSNFKLFWGEFANIDTLLEDSEHRLFDGILADLGVSSPQLDQPERGFQYKGGELLDMRQDQSQELTAKKLIDNSNEEGLFAIFKVVLQPRLARLVARIINQAKPIQDANHLARIIREKLPAYIVRQKNPLKAIYLALRIAVNGEVSQLERLSSIIPKLLKRESNLVFITFNSLEDRLVKRLFSEFKNRDDNYRGLSTSEFRYQTKTI